MAQLIATNQLTLTNVNDGQTAVVHWAYSENADGTGLTLTDNGQRYIGHYSDYTQADSTDKTKYRWVDRWAKIEVGGRNLLPRSGNFTDTRNWSSYTGVSSVTVSDGKLIVQTGSTGYPRLRNSKLFPLSAIREQYTVSVEYVSDTPVRLIGKSSSSLTSFNENGAQNIGTIQVVKDVNLGGDRKRSIFSWLSLAMTDTLKSSWIMLGLPLNATVEIINVKVEKGTVATDWTQAPEDLQSQIDSKADQALTQERINALNEQRGIYQAELEARATASELEEWVNAYNNYVKANDQNKKEAEASLISTSIRVADVEKVLGAMKERWDFILNYMDVSEDGLFFGKKDGSAEVRVYGDRISMFVAGNEVMYLSQDTININNGIFSTSIQIGRFKEEQYKPNPDINIIRYIR